MRASLFIKAFLLPAILTGCGTVSTIPISTTSVRVVERTELKPITVFAEIPQISQEVAVKDSSSHLENDYCLSDASIDRKGVLHHSLSTKPQKQAQIVEVPTVYRDSTVIVEKIVEKEVPADLNWHQKARLKGFWILLALALVAYGKYIIKLIK